MKTRSTKEMMVKYSAKAMGCAFLSAVCLMGAPRQMSYASETEITEAAVQTMSEAAQAVAEEIQALEIHSREEAKALVPLYVRYNALSAAEKESISEDVKQLLEAATETAAAYNHSDQGVTVTGDIPWYTQIQVSIREDASESVNGLDIIVPYDIVLWDLYTDSEYVLNGETVTIGIPKPDVEVDGDMKILHYLHDGSMEELTPEVNGGMLYFQTDSFSPFSLAGQTIIGIGPGSSTQADDETETDDTTSSTDTNSADTNTTNTDTNTSITNN
ncbi:MAG: hypothetical protein Q4F41_07730, partial [Eubacteriales bacterium]|nr:hypothetical protein [Eubacteriales bacterium]